MWPNFSHISSRIVEKPPVLDVVPVDVVVAPAVSSAVQSYFASASSSVSRVEFS